MKSSMSMMMDSALFIYGLIALLLFYVVNVARVALRKGLRTLPGPFLARISGFYRLSLVWSGDAPRKYRSIHEKYGSVVRIGPNHVSVADPAMVPIIYGVGSGFLKTSFYKTMTPFIDGQVLESMFTTRDPAYHKALKSPVAQIFSMTNMRNFETYADECTGIFIEHMRRHEGQPLDLATWLQWYAFDVIASITFQRRFGFMEQETDIDNMIYGLDTGLQYVKVVGQFPAWHPWLMGNRPLMRLLVTILPNIPDVLGRFIDITKEEIKRYDLQEKQSGRTDFLAQLRSKGDKISDRDLLNHLSNNLLAGSDTTAISLRACFYYLLKTPRAYKKLVDEIDEAHQRQDLSEYVSYEECLKLPYLQAVLKEAMRMHPGVGFPLERFVPEGGVTVSGVHLPAGTNISMSAPVLHYSKEVFGQDADLFRPERWIEADPEQLKLMNRSFLAFGYGTRTCIGKNISIMEMGKFVPQILRYFDIAWASPDPEWKTHAAWFWKQSAIIVQFRWREKHREATWAA